MGVATSRYQTHSFIHQALTELLKFSSNTQDNRENPRWCSPLKFCMLCRVKEISPNSISCQWERVTFDPNRLSRAFKYITTSRTRPPCTISGSYVDVGVWANSSWMFLSFLLSLSRDSRPQGSFLTLPTHSTSLYVVPARKCLLVFERNITQFDRKNVKIGTSSYQLKIFYGHRSRACKNSATCVKCGEAGHKAASCSNQELCVNCKGKQAASSRACPKWKLEKRCSR